MNREGSYVSTLTTSSRIAPQESALATTVDGEAVVLETESGTYYGLNEVATFVWDELDDPRTLADLRDAVVDEFDADPERVEADLRAVLEDMQDNGLIAVETDD